MKLYSRFLSLLLAVLVLFSASALGETALRQPDDAGISQYDYDNDPRTDAYADYIVQYGLNVQKGDYVVIQAPVLAWPLVNIAAKKCYAAGAASVNVLYNDPAFTATTIASLSDNQYSNFSFSDMLATAAVGLMGNTLQALVILSPTPSVQPVDSQTQQAYASAGQESIKRLLSIQPDTKRSAPDRWCAVAYPNVDWAREVYPEYSDEEALSALWEDIYAYLYMTPEAPTTDALVQHTAELDKRAEQLTKMNIRALHFTNSQTDLTVGLHQSNIFQSPTSTTSTVNSLPNIPCEECFGMPEKHSVNGYVATSRPLVLDNGTIINNMRLTFKDGQVTEWSADTGMDALNALMEKENARYLGEVSIVSAKTPLFESGRVFYTTLLDENAACHLAFGNCYMEYNLPAGVAPDDECNQSPIHVDFMIGTTDTTITAILQDGTEQVIFKDGDWAF